MGHSRIELFGRFRGIYQDKEVAAPASRRCEELLTYLLLAGQDRYQRLSLARFFWPDQSDDKAAALLRQNLYLIQQWLTDELQCPQLLDVQRSSVSVNHDIVEVDVLQFERAYAAAQQHRHRRLAGCVHCLAQLSAVVPTIDVSPVQRTSRRAADNYLAWLELRFSGTQQALSDVFDAQSQLLERNNRLHEAILTARQRLDLDPWNEPAQRAVITLLARAGQRSEALRQFHQSRALLHSELGIDVEPATLLLIERIRANRPLDADQAPPLMLNVPRLYGRDEELAELRRLLSSAEQRLISIVGIGGIGKTVLARAVAVEQQQLFRDGALYIALEHVSTYEGMLQLIAEALQLPGGSSVLRQLAARLHQRELLIVLDNVEQIDGADQVLSDLLAVTNATVFLITSRRPLRLQRETLVRLDSVAEQSDTAEAAAVELFLARAGQYDRRRDWQAELPAIRTICRLCGGLPLAIELAAYQARYRSCDDIAAALRTQPTLLQAELHDLPERQRDVAGVLLQSWQYVSDRHRPLLAALSLFRAPFSLQTARSVLQSAADLSTIEAAVQYAIDLGLLRRTTRHELAIHPLIQQFLTGAAADDPAVVAAIRTGYRRYHLQLVIDAGLSALNTGARRFARQQAPLRDDIIQAWRLSAAAGDSRLLFDAVVPLALWAVAGGWATQLDDLIDSTLSEGSCRLTVDCRRRLLGVRTFLYTELQDPRRVRPVLAELLQEPLPQPLFAEQALALRITVRMDLISGALDQVPALIERSTDVEADHSFHLLSATADGLIGRYHVARGEYAQAESFLNRALHEARLSGDQRNEIGMLNELALLPARQGDLARSVPQLEETVGLTRQFEDSNALSVLLANLGNARQAAGGDLDRALSELAEAAELARVYANPGYLRTAVAGLGRIMHLYGRHDLAIGYLRDRLQLDCDLGFLSSTGEALIQYLESLHAQGRHSTIGPLLLFAADFPQLPAALRERAGTVHQAVFGRPLPAGNAAAAGDPDMLRLLLH